MTSEKTHVAEIRALLRQLGLAPMGAHPIAKPLAARGAAYRLDYPDGTAYFAKSLPEAVSPGDVLLDALIAENAPLSGASLLRPATKANTEHWLVTDFVPHEGTLISAPAGMVSPACAAEVGRALALLHSLPGPDAEAPQSLAQGQQPRRPAVWALPTVTEYAMLPGLDRDLVLRSWQACAGAIEALETALGSDCLVHGDLHSNNLLLARDGAAIIDWSEAGAGDRHWDLGHLLSGLIRRWARSLAITAKDPDSILNAGRQDWLVLAKWYGRTLAAYETPLDARLLTAVAGYALLKRTRSLLYSIGRLSAREAFLLAVAERLLLTPEAACKWFLAADSMTLAGGPGS